MLRFLFVFRLPLFCEKANHQKKGYSEIKRLHVETKEIPEAGVFKGVKKYLIENPA